MWKFRKAEKVRKSNGSFHLEAYCRLKSKFSTRTWLLLRLKKLMILTYDCTILVHIHI